ncbi:uncharacterized protein MONBRDRAFT_36941 [Monosiga brevicollis MX1]|uniref:Aminotransferase class V domain-containing protein n=1 Tax=Monosiga brevicollis TaxID=81824 RepID=A9UYJ8_MONBE|nr:uncharacterized protein MONBRDRAFT_36941 [Monosiga brevicollis MX1]EDQ89474.1 predicted protein [Monosiga brevicollis MX1]|eukprot:XP_001745503.1 hypothetical protein [Monosiga brevicollis MX1]
MATPATDHAEHERAEASLRPDQLKLLEQIRSNVIGDCMPLDGPFGSKPLIYADYTASGRSLGMIENFIQQRVLPMYANTHTDASATGRQTSHAREEARNMVLSACGGNTHEHAVIFTGSGSTSAIYKFMGLLDVMPLPTGHAGVRAPKARNTLAKLDKAEVVETDLEPEDKRKSRRTKPAAPKNKHPMPPRRRRAVVFISEYEHHSNDLPWREAPVDLVRVRCGTDEHVCLKHLEKLLKKYRKRPLLIGSFSAGSNVTGLLSPVPELARLLHRYGALACFDYAAAAPYVPIALGSKAYGNEGYLDAVYISPHKFIGGPGTPGLLLVRRDVCRNAVPVVPGGGTVRFVSADAHLYTREIEHREEGGTPDIVGAVRCGLVFELKHRVGEDFIVAREHELLERAWKVWSTLPEQLVLLGPQKLPKLTITSFIIKFGKRMLHYNFVVALLNDIFGIQSRGGCSCAGPYGLSLLKPSQEVFDWVLTEMGGGHDGAKMGWTRVNFPYFFTDEQADYVIQAVALVAQHGWRLLPHYTFDLNSGIWTHKSQSDQPVSSLLALFDRPIAESKPSAPASTTIQPDYNQLLAQGREILMATSEPVAASLQEEGHDADSGVHDTASTHSNRKKKTPALVRWYMLPEDCQDASLMKELVAKTEAWSLPTQQVVS